jgi:multidrug transporter EmrE-like cation transporter
MNTAVGYFLVALTIILTVLGQFLIKWQAGSAGQIPADSHGRIVFTLELLTRPWIIVGLASAFLASICWMLAMTKLPLSNAYPFTAATFVLVVLGGAWLFSEPITLGKLLGVGLIVAGVMLTGIE